MRFKSLLPARLRHGVRHADRGVTPAAESEPAVVNQREALHCRETSPAVRLRVGSRLTLLPRACHNPLLQQQLLQHCCPARPGQISMFNRGSQRDMTSLPVYTKDGSPRHPSSRLLGVAGAAGATAPQQHASQLLQQMSAGLWTLAAPLAPVAVLCAGIYVTSLEAGPGRPVDRQSCSCNCWDGRFKGRHGLATSGIQYKSIYFNLEPATALLAAWVCIWLNLLGLCLQRILQLTRAGRLSVAALVPALLQFYPMFYGAWAVFNYVNDRFYVMLPSQLFFQITELVPCFFIVTLLDTQNHKQLQLLVPVLGLAVNTAHVVIALKERVLWGLFLPGINTVNGRDVMLMAGDISCLVFFGTLLHRLKPNQVELRQAVPWGVCTAVVLVLVYILGLGYVYQ